MRSRSERTCWSRNRKNEPRPVSATVTNTDSRKARISLTRSVGNMLLRHHLVAEAPHRHDLGGGAFDLVAQPGDVHIERAGIAEEILAPDQIQQPVARHRHALVLGE